MNQQMNTLVVDDEKGIRFFLQETLHRDGHTVETASSGEEALAKLRDTHFDLVMLDLRLGGRADGIRVLEAIRWRWPETMVIILTAHGSLDTAMAAIREGVEGYLLKPVDPSEVREAIREALERREMITQRAKEEEERHIIKGGPFTVDTQKHQAFSGEEILDLTPCEFKLLTHMIQNAERVIGPPELVEIVRDYKPEDLHEARQIIKWYIHRLRQKVEPEPSSPRYILNVRGVGYTFKN
jgi:DNA-binding response OmpR family regulator